MTTNNHMKNNQTSSWHQNLYSFLFDIHTKHGKRAEWVWMSISIASVALIFLESADPEVNNNIPTGKNVYFILEVLFTAIFTLEYILRLLSEKRMSTYVFSFLGVVDVVTTLPLYILLLYPDIACEYFTLLRMLRVMRILRVFKIMHYMGSVNLLWESIYGIRKKLLIFFTFVFIQLCLFGGIMYVIEGPENGFTSLHVAVYWGVVTMTTVGYGDITPHTALGRCLASILILIGYSIIAIPTGVLTAHMTDLLQRRRHTHRCSNCNKTGHDEDAAFCKACGHPFSVSRNNG